MFARQVRILLEVACCECRTDASEAALDTLAAELAACDKCYFIPSSGQLQQSAPPP